MLLSLLVVCVILRVNGLSSSESIRPSLRAQRAKSGNDAIELRELSNEERQKEWAARIIEDHERRKKSHPQSSMRRSGPQRVSIVPSGGPVVVESGDAQESPGQPEEETSSSKTRNASENEETASNWQKTLLDVFDGRLGAMRLALRASSEGMLSVTARLEASPAAEDGVIVLRAQGVECLLDTRRCAGIEFTTRSDDEKHVQFAITVKRRDQESFLSVLLGEDDLHPIPTEVAKRWQDLRELYGTTFF